MTGLPPWVRVVLGVALAVRGSSEGCARAHDRGKRHRMVEEAEAGSPDAGPPAD